MILSKKYAVWTALGLILGLVGGCNPSAQKATTTPSSAAKKKEYAFALIAKNQGNPVFQAARVGAEDAARDLGRSWAYQSRRCGARRTKRMPKSRPSRSSSLWPRASTALRSVVRWPKRSRPPSTPRWTKAWRSSASTPMPRRASGSVSTARTISGRAARSCASWPPCSAQANTWWPSPAATRMPPTSRIAFAAPRGGQKTPKHHHQRRILQQRDSAGCGGQDRRGPDGQPRHRRLGHDRDPGACSPTP